MYGHWTNKTGIPRFNPMDYLGFIYRIRSKDGSWYYYGRKQFKSYIKRSKKYRETDWKSYQSSSRNVRKALRTDEAIYEILAVFSSKSAIRYGEILAIVVSGAYERHSCGWNWGIEGARGYLKLTDTDKQQLKHLRRVATLWYNRG